jgi:hypothetical protein
MPSARSWTTLALCALLLVLATTALAAGPGVKGTRCSVFPADNPWNQRVDDLPVAENSDTLVASIGRNESAHADFGSGRWNGGPIGIPYVIVSKRTKRRKVSFGYADESDRVRYPIPKNPPIEGGRNGSGDRHIIMVDKSRCKLFELYAAYPKRRSKSWRAGSGAAWSLRSNKLRPAGWTSADAAGLPIFPGLARYDEVAGGAIEHALRFTAPRTRNSYVYPARHRAGAGDGAALPPMGLRLRLKQSVNISSFPPQSRVVLTALRRYGMLLADNGSPWYISGAPDRRWDNDDLHSFQRLDGRDFEVVDTSSLPTPGR